MLYSFCELHNSLFSIPDGSKAMKFTLSSSYMNRFGVSVVYSASMATKFHLVKNRFRNFLDRALCFESLSALKYHTYIDRVQFSFEGVTIEGCEFARIENPSKTGGAVMCLGSLKIEDSLFTQCEGDRGGAVLCRGGFIMQHSTILKCRASQGGGFDLVSHGTDRVELMACLFLENHATFFGTFYKSSRGYFDIDDVNFTRPQAKECVGNFETDMGALKMQYTITYEVY